jgi:hypothetical protein
VPAKDFLAHVKCAHRSVLSGAQASGSLFALFCCIISGPRAQGFIFPGPRARTGSYQDFLWFWLEDLLLRSRFLGAHPYSLARLLHDCGRFSAAKIFLTSAQPPSILKKFIFAASLIGQDFCW